MVKDARGHLHDAVGRFARTGAKKVVRDRRRGKTATTIRPHITELQAQERYINITNNVLRARHAFRQHARGERVSEPSLIFYRGHHHGQLTKNHYDAVVDAAGQARWPTKPRLRHTTKRTASGKAYVVRGWGIRYDAHGNEQVIKPKTPKKNLAGKKPDKPSRIIDIRTPGRHGRHAAGKTARQMMGRS